MTVCSSCGREFEAASDEETLCPQCAAEITAPDPEPAPRSRWRLYLQSPTLAILAINVLVFVAMAIQGRSILAIDSELLLYWGGNYAPLTSGGQWWRLLSSTFEHGGLVHIALNMWCLFSLGWLAELLFGRSRFTILYLLCGIGGSLASIGWRGNGLSVGASGAIFGVAGALIPAMLLHSNPQLRAVLKGRLVGIIIFVAYSITFGARSSVVDNAAHIGGVVTGLILGTIFPTGAERESLAGRLRVVAGCLLVIALFLGAGSYARQRNLAYIEIEAAGRAHDAGDDAAAIVHARRSVAQQPENAQAQFMLGTLLLTGRQYEESVAPFAATVKLRPQFGPAYVNLCAAQLGTHRMSEALSNCERGAQLAPADSQSWFNLGRARYEMHNVPGARDAMAKAVQLNPRGFDENLHYALMLISNNQAQAALPYMQKAHDLHPDDEGVNRMLTELRSH